MWKAQEKVGKSVPTIGGALGTRNPGKDGRGRSFRIGEKENQKAGLYRVCWLMDKGRRVAFKKEGEITPPPPSPQRIITSIVIGRTREDHTKFPSYQQLKLPCSWLSVTFSTDVRYL